MSSMWAWIVPDQSYSATAFHGLKDCLSPLESISQRIVVSANCCRTVTMTPYIFAAQLNKTRILLSWLWHTAARKELAAVKTYTDRRPPGFNRVPDHPIISLNAKEAAEARDRLSDVRHAAREKARRLVSVNADAVPIKNSSALSILTLNFWNLILNNRKLTC